MESLCENTGNVHSFLNGANYRKGLRNVVSASCLLISAGVSGALGQSDDLDTSLRVLEELERKQAEAHTLVETLESASNRILGALETERVLYHTTADSTTKLHYYSPWTNLEKTLKDADGNGNSYAVGTGVLHSDVSITNNTPRHRVCLRSGQNANAKMPDVSSNFGVLTYFDRDSYGVSVTPQELLALAVSHTAKPGVVKGMPLGIGVVTVNGSTLQFTDIGGASSSLPDCLADTGTWGSGLDGARLAIYMPNVKPRQLRFVFSKLQENVFGDRFSAPVPTEVSSKGMTCGSGTIDASKVVGRPLYTRLTLRQIAKDAGGNFLRDSEGNLIDTVGNKDVWADVLASTSGGSATWNYDEASCRAKYTYRTTVEEDCRAKVRGEYTVVTRKVGLKMVERMPLGTNQEYYYEKATVDQSDPDPTNWTVTSGSINTRTITDASKVFSPTRYYYESGDTISYEVDNSFGTQIQASLCDSYRGLEIDLRAGTSGEFSDRAANADTYLNNPDGTPGSGNSPTTPHGSTGLDWTPPPPPAQCTNDALPAQRTTTVTSLFGVDPADPKGFSVWLHYLAHGGKIGPLAYTHEPSDWSDLASLPNPWDVFARRTAYTGTTTSHVVDKRVAHENVDITDTVNVPGKYRVRIGQKYDSWNDFDANFPKPDGVSDAEFSEQKGLMKQAYAFWADSDTETHGNAHPNLNTDGDIYSTGNANDTGVCASDYGDMTLIYKIVGMQYYKDVALGTKGNDYGQTATINGGQVSVTNNLPWLEPPWYPSDHPYYTRHMDLLDKSGYTKHRTNETLKADIKADFETNKKELFGSTYKASFDESTGVWSIHTISFNSGSFPNLKSAATALGDSAASTTGYDGLEVVTDEIGHNPSKGTVADILVKF